MIRFCCFLLLVGFASAKFECLTSKGIGPGLKCADTKCMRAIDEQIYAELDAAFKYLYLGAYFGQDNVHRPGLFKFFLESASEERSHAMLMLDYLNTRGYEIKLRDNQFPAMHKPVSDISVQDAVKTALDMEIVVTSKIHEVINSCEEDFHGADTFTEPIMTEQHDGVRQLQGALKVLNQLKRDHDNIDLADSMFDRMILNGKI